MPSISRRRFVGGSLGALGAAGVVNALPDSVQKAVAEASDRPDPLNPDGYELPFHLDSINTSAAAVTDLSHAWPVQHAA